MHAARTTQLTADGEVLGRLSSEEKELQERAQSRCKKPHRFEGPVAAANAIEEEVPNELCLQSRREQVAHGSLPGTKELPHLG